MNMRGAHDMAEALRHSAVYLELASRLHTLPSDAPDASTSRLTLGASCPGAAGRPACDGEPLASKRAFYEEYRAVMDLPADYYLQTIERVFQEHHLPRGLFRHRDHLVEPAAITRTAMLTVEGERGEVACEVRGDHGQVLEGVAPLVVDRERRAINQLKRGEQRGHAGRQVRQRQPAAIGHPHT